MANLTALTRARVGAFQRTFQLGGLVTVVLAEDRLGFRTSGEAVVTTTDPADGLPGSAFYQQLGGLDCPACPTASTACLTAQITAYLTAVATNGASGYPTQCSPQLLSYVYNTGAINFANWTASMIQAGKAFSFAMETLQTYNGNNTQHIIGTTPAIYLGTQFAASKAAGVPFQVWASQTVFLPTPWPDLINATAHGRANSQALGKGGFLSGLCGSSFAPSCCACRRARLYRSSADAPVADNALTGGTFGSDNWVRPEPSACSSVARSPAARLQDGFNTERNFITAMLSLGNTPIINSGDSHSFWLGVVPNVTFASGPTQPAVIEFGGGAITSPGWGDSFGTSGGPVPGYTLGTAEQAFMNFVEDGHVLAAAGAGFGLKTVRHAHGALIFQVNATSYVGQVMTVDTTNSTTYRAMCDYAYQVLPGTKGVFTSLAVGQTGARARESVSCSASVPLTLAPDPIQATPATLAACPPSTARCRAPSSWGSRRRSRGTRRWPPPGRATPPCRSRPPSMRSTSPPLHRRMRAPWAGGLWRPLWAAAFPGRRRRRLLPRSSPMSLLLRGTRPTPRTRGRPCFPWAACRCPSTRRRSWPRPVSACRPSAW